MQKNNKYDYRKAEADLCDAGSFDQEEVYEYRSEKAFRKYMKENGLNPDKYVKNEHRRNSAPPDTELLRRRELHVAYQLYKQYSLFLQSRFTQAA